MPAIPVYARLEAHMHDDELVALREFLGHAIVCHYGTNHSPLVRAAAGNQLHADKMLRACKAIHRAAEQAIKERAAS